MRSRRFTEIMVFVCVVAVFGAMVAVYFIGRGHGIPKPPSTSGSEETTYVEPPALELLSVSERGEWMLVETTYGFFRYPTAFSDFLAPEVIDQGTSARLQFIAQIAEQSLVVYTIHYNEVTGNRCGTLKLSADTKEIPVYVSFSEANDAIPADWLDTFYAVQETFNDVLSSMAEDSRFVREEQ